LKDKILCSKCESLSEWNMYFQKYICVSCNNKQEESKGCDKMSGNKVDLLFRCMFCGKEGTAKVSNKYKYNTSKAICPSCNGEENEWGLHY